ncbi:hypothetical protein EV207_11960 [Scopulibacillus darangshiensis]|uniref:Inhibitor of sigma-G Gin protein n=1 Tax=Scopulibacillus darangshiensis TaxID=442528 RepID=A0A4R2NWR8_9BACL|nr:hypothetical protein [Scopulibacillus darangshiensis]TCP26629.1 hypothetical protein EV207_11960 [Scopulibacillus darangshiensis]
MKIREPVGPCIDCGKMVYCVSGFLNGIVLDNHNIRCYDCHEEMEGLEKEEGE